MYAVSKKMWSVKAVKDKLFLYHISLMVYFLSEVNFFYLNFVFYCFVFVQKYIPFFVCAILPIICLLMYYKL